MPRYDRLRKAGMLPVKEMAVLLGNDRKAHGAGSRGRAFVPRKSAKKVSYFSTDFISCTCLVPFCAHAKNEALPLSS
jgi:hypothetical protein